MRLHPALVAGLLPLASVAQTDEWVRDDMSDESLWLLRTANLAREAPRSAALPGAPDGASHWVMSKGDGPAYVVYFIPGRIHEVEIDTHRLAGAAGDFTLAVSTDGKLYQPLDAGAVLLDSSFGWDYRLMASDQIPENATHLLVQFPDNSTAHGLSEVWIRYTWDDALAGRFLPAPAPVEVPAPNTLAAHSDEELLALLQQLEQSPSAPSALPDAQEVFAIAQPVDVLLPQPTPETLAPVANMPQPAAQEPAPSTVSELPAIGAAEAWPTHESERIAEPIESPAQDAVVALPPPETSDEENADDSPAEIATLESSEALLAVNDAVSPDASSETPVADAVQLAAQPESIETKVEAVVIADGGQKQESVVAPVADALVEVATAEPDDEVTVLPAFILPVLATTEPETTGPVAPAVVIESPAPEPAPAAIAQPEPGPEAPPPSQPEPPAGEKPSREVPSAAPLQSSAAPATPAAEAVEPAIAAPIEPQSSAVLSETDDPLPAKPVLKVRRIGPRSKSRG